MYFLYKLKLCTYKVLYIFLLRGHVNYHKILHHHTKSLILARPKYRSLVHLDGMQSTSLSFVFGLRLHKVLNIGPNLIALTSDQNKLWSFEEKSKCREKVYYLTTSLKCVPTILLVIFYQLIISLLVFINKRD